MELDEKFIRTLSLQLLGVNVTTVSMYFFYMIKLEAWFYWIMAVVIHTLCLPQHELLLLIQIKYIKAVWAIDTAIVIEIL